MAESTYTEQDRHNEGCCWDYVRQLCPGRGCLCNCHATNEEILLSDRATLRREVAHLTAENAALRARAEAALAFLEDGINSCRGFDDDGNPLTEGPFPCESFCENQGHHTLMEIRDILTAAARPDQRAASDEKIEDIRRLMTKHARSFEILEAHERAATQDATGGEG